MATNFPENIDNIVKPEAKNPLSNPSHSEQHINISDAITAIQTKVGVDNSTDTNSLDYRLSQLETESGSDIAEKLGLDGNNTLSVTGIENPTVIDTFDSSIWGSAFYRVKLVKDDKVYTSTLSVVIENSQISMSEYDVISNYEGDLAHLEFTKTGSIINLLVNPVLYPVEIRFYRTALKK